MKGIILSGGSGTRLHPATYVVSKQLLPVFDKPMVYYPLSILMLAGIRDILLITTEVDLPLYKKLLGDGSQWGVFIQYKIQPRPEGLAQAFILGEDFIGRDSVCMILGDNLFYGNSLAERVTQAAKLKEGATVFAYWVKDPERYGVLELNDKNEIISIEEKPKIPKSNWAITGIYFFDRKVTEIAKQVKPSARGELEITSVIEAYMKEKTLRAEFLGRGFAWLDTGTHESLLEASNFISTVENRQGLKIACLEEIAYLRGFIDEQQLRKLAEPLQKTEYGKYLLNVIERK